MRGALLVAVVVVAGCNSPRSWVYSPAARQSRAPVVDAALAVPPLLDRRSNDNTNAWALYLIPLMPYGYQDYPAPEGANMHLVSGDWKFKPPEDFARALAQEVDAARIFRESFFSERAAAGDFVLRGEIVSTQYDGKLLSYCLSVYGPLLWFIGLPSSYVSEEIELHLTLTRANSDVPIWSHVARSEHSETKWVYAPGTDFFYDAMLKDAMPGVLSALEAAARDPAIATVR